MPCSRTLSRTLRYSHPRTWGAGTRAAAKGSAGVASAAWVSVFAEGVRTGSGAVERDTDGVDAAAGAGPDADGTASALVERLDPGDRGVGVRAAAAGGGPLLLDAVTAGVDSLRRRCRSNWPACRRGSPRPRRGDCRQDDLGLVRDDQLLWQLHCGWPARLVGDEAERGHDDDDHPQSQASRIRCQRPLARPIVQRPDGSGVPGMGGVEGAGIGTGVAILGGQAKGLFEVGERGPDVSKGARRLRRGLTQRVHYWPGPTCVPRLGGSPCGFAARLTDSRAITAASAGRS